MKRLMFYCQHILGIGHMIRSLEILRGLTSDFQICLINGGEVIEGLQIPSEIDVINLPPIKTDAEFQSLLIPGGFTSLEAVFEVRKQRLLEVFDRHQPDVLMVELFPFGRRKFSPELIPLLETAKIAGTQIVCSLRDIVVTKQDRDRHEEKICTLMNRYFDLLLIHGDSQFMPLEVSFSRVADLTCPVHYTGYVVQQDLENLPAFHVPHPLILTTVGGGRFGHELLNCVAQASALLEDQIPHHIQMFTGPFSPDDVLKPLQAIAAQRRNLTVERYTPRLLHYMRQADLSISMAGYNTTMNVLTTGVRAMLLPFTGNDDQEQRIRSERLQELGVVSVIQPEELQPERLAQKIVACLQQPPAPTSFNVSGVETTAYWVKAIAQHQQIAV
ncbi:MAG: glycosyl transferase [Drouetiella hepatica Uher 2000/2452]|jgi:predicted glycosyltransferase|uniref:Glycosyl transferase n=1 Tax=Drouetiella hepatica Uher 2000/2452 TaxID=904376 RepID=A0A951QE31_9CYAN|nr:glycosyl transferase [Drouetiella hepatica Uher 2000/2452]